jgi:hypothetical protein
MPFLRCIYTTDFLVRFQVTIRSNAEALTTKENANIIERGIKCAITKSVLIMVQLNQRRYKDEFTSIKKLDK